MYDEYDAQLLKIENEKRILHGIRINDELMEHLSSTIRWLMHYCEKNNMRPPNLEHLSNSVKKAHEYLHKLPSNQPSLNRSNHQPPTEQNLMRKALITA